MRKIVTYFFLYNEDLLGMLVEISDKSFRNINPPSPISEIIDIFFNSLIVLFH